MKLFGTTQVSAATVTAEPAQLAILQLALVSAPTIIATNLFKATTSKVILKYPLGNTTTRTPAVFQYTIYLMLSATTTPIQTQTIEMTPAQAPTVQAVQLLTLTVCITPCL